MMITISNGMNVVYESHISIYIYIYIYICVCMYNIHFILGIYLYN